MTVAELREKLEEFSDDLTVIASVHDGEPIQDVELAENWLLDKDNYETVVMIS